MTFSLLPFAFSSSFFSPVFFSSLLEVLPLPLLLKKGKWVQWGGLWGLSALCPWQCHFLVWWGWEQKIREKVATCRMVVRLGDLKPCGKSMWKD